MTKPQILDEGSGKLSTKGLYNLKLAIQILDGSQLDVVKNDFEFSKEHGIYIMTGPNRGGKTTFTQAVGLIVLLAQNGLYVPCEALSLSPCDNIFTHFPADENQTVNLGRLGEESKRISVQRIPCDDLVHRGTIYSKGRGQGNEKPRRENDF